jgi:hypothetical protein
MHNFHPPLTISSMYDCWVTVWFNDVVNRSFFTIETMEVSLFLRLRIGNQ